MLSDHFDRGNKKKAAPVCLLSFELGLLLYMYRSALQGMGDTVIPMVSGIVELCMRIGVALLLTGIIGSYGIFLGEVSAWGGAAILLGYFYYKKIREFKKRV